MHRDCWIRRTSVDGIENIVLVKPDAKPRYLVVSPDRQRLVPTDGGPPVQTIRHDPVYVVTVGDDRYFVPIESYAKRD